MANTIDWTRELSEQLTWHWEAQLRPRLDGLSDEEYFWEPVRGCWNVRRAGTGATPMAAGSGEYELDYAYPEPTPAPVTTIAWRLCHVLMGVLDARNGRYFGTSPVDPMTYDYPGTAAEALRRLDDSYRIWTSGIATLGPDELAANCREPGFEQATMAGLVLHIHREVIHHGAEISLLRDLYAWRG